MSKAPRDGSVSASAGTPTERQALMIRPEAT